MGEGIQAVSASSVNGLAVYALVKTKLSKTDDTYSLFFSLDGGLTWAKRYEAVYANTTSLVIQAVLWALVGAIAGGLWQRTDSRAAAA